MNAESPRATAPHAELDVAQWRDVFGHLDVLLAVSPDARMAAMSDRSAIVSDVVVASVLKDFCQRTTLADALDATDIAAVSQALLGGSHLEAGQRCGNYRLIEPIGQGGMGSVWRAARMDGLYQSKVAVKLLGSLALSAHARARFAREGELLARLSHPSIARLLDAGLTDDHQRFLVLELVAGQDIVSHVTAHPLEQKAILLLFRQLLAAVAFAHSQLVVHRDIKPGNVMVTLEGQVKLLDFGVAKLLDESSDETADNQLTRVVGAAYTEAYAAPEQLRGDPASTAADIFSCAALLHELLIGQRPQWTGPKHTLLAGQQATTLSSSRDSPSHDLAPDLKAILAKALAVDPAERYATITAFDDDLARYLSGAPVRAQPSTRAYRLRKFLSRNKLPLLLGAAASTAVVVSLAAALWQLQEARTQRAQAVAEAGRANQVTSFLTGLFRASDPRLASIQDKQTLTARQLLETGSERLKAELNDQPETKIALLGILAEIYGFLDDEKRFLELNGERVKLASERFGPLHPAVIEGRLTDADSDLYAGNFDSARATLVELESAVRKVFGPDSERYANWLSTMAELERRARKEPRDAVIVRFERALAAFQKIGSKSEAAAVALQNYSTALSDAGRLQEALAANGRAIVLMENIKDFDQGSLSISHERRAEILQALDRHGEVEAELDHALALLEKSYGAGNTLYLDELLTKAHWLHDRGRRAEAWALVDRVFAAPRQQSSDPFGVPEEHYIKGLLLLNESRAAEAVPELRRAADGWRDANNNPGRLRKAEAALAKAQMAVARS